MPLDEAREKSAARAPGTSTSRSSARVAVIAGRSRVVSSRSMTPLRLLTPDNHGHAAWIYQSSHGGGFVGADDVALDVDVDANATLFLSTQASSKVYRAARSRFTLNARIASGATLIAWPDATVCFAGASLVQSQHVALASDANLLVVDAYTAGRSARGERWAFDRLSSKIAVDVDGAPALRDAVLLERDIDEDAVSTSLRERMAHVDACATAILAGPAFVHAAREIVARIAREPLDHARDPRARAPLVVASARPFGAVIRVAAPQVDQLSASLHALLDDVVAAALGDDPFCRKW